MDIMHSFIYMFRESSVGDIDLGTEIRDAIKTSEKEIYKEMNRKAIRFKDKIELELYIKMRSYMLGRGTAVLMKDVPLEILNRYQLSLYLPFVCPFIHAYLRPGLYILCVYI
jgi:shikimate kinase